ncbi:MAG: putative polysaccharide export protein, partial [Phycisphaerales bacterium]|nr:putative polysaccharide export protein [Phycisphaerales bacterium]
MRLSRGTAKRNPARLLAAIGATTLGAGLLAGCQNANPLDIKSFIDPSELAGRVRKDTLVVKILNQVDPAIEEPNREFVTAQPPTQDDLVVSATDYVISKNDLLSLEISDLGGPGTQTVKTTRVSESGNISLPFVGQIKAEGKTEFELQQAIEEAYRTANIIQRAQVSVTVGEARGRAISILGAVTQPGQYALVDPDFRVLDALTLARDTTSPLISDLYIIRRTDLSRPSTRPAGTGPADGGASPA